MLNQAQWLDFIKKDQKYSKKAIIKDIFEELNNELNREINKLEKQIHQGFCSDETQDKNYEILDKISILENIKNKL